MLKKFNLEEFKAGKSALTRGGETARFLTTINTSPFSIVVAIASRDGYEYLDTVAEDGVSSIDDEGSNDLIAMKSELNSPQKFFQVCEIDSAGTFKPFHTLLIDAGNNWFDTEEEAVTFITDYFIDAQQPDGERTEYTLTILPIFNVRL